MKEVLIATLGVSPQIVTISLDLLRERGCTIDEVTCIYTNNEKVKEALAQVDEELNRLGGPPHRPVLIVGENGPVSDFMIEADATALLRTLYREIKAYKEAGRRIQLLIAGGRRVMSAYALVVAQMLFDADDRAWHLFSDFWQRDRDRKLHAEPGDHALLVPVPVLRWTPMAAVTADLALTDDPWQVINRQQELEQRERDIRLHAFLHQLTNTQRDIARLLASGLDNQSIAARRNKSISTVTKQLSVVYEEWRTSFGIPPHTPVRDQIVAELSGYFARKGEEGIEK
jgi:CRISPR-associated protein Csx14